MKYGHFKNKMILSTEPEILAEMWHQIFLLCENHIVNPIHKYKVEIKGRRLSIALTKANHAYENLGYV